MARPAHPSRRLVARAAPVTVWYDGACPLCSREIALLRRLDRRGAINFVDLVGQDGQCPLDRTMMLERLHVMVGAELLNGAAAFAALWRAIPLLRPLGELARIPGILWLLERLYRGFLRLRPRLQRLLS